jgi:hypothetical protein
MLLFTCFIIIINNIIIIISYFSADLLERKPIGHIQLPKT